MILGIGNPLMGDDGVGIRIVHNLMKQPRQLAFAGDNVEVIDGGTLGYLLIDRLMDVADWIVVDAANLSAIPGSVKVFRGDEMDAFLTTGRSASVHEVGLIDLMEMLTLLGHLPQRRALVAVQPEIIDWQTDLSPAVAASLSRAEAAVIEVLRDWHGVTTR
jgi:hydrogenase maturation protease